jgi:predicted  nucleic acid-binding Zn-ribbon protein
MNADLERLVRLQQAETNLKRVESSRLDLPRLRAEAAAALEAEKTRLAAAREAVESCQKARRKYEAELQDLEAKRSRYKSQLMDVKTNKEYTAMLHEIEGVEREIRAREDLVLAEMEKAESLTAEAKREEKAFQAADEQARTRGREMDEEERRLQAEADRLGAERDAVAAEVPSAMLELFQRVARVRGTAVSEATKDAMCSQCHVKLRPQMFVDLKRGDEMFQCPQCNRILYYEAPVPVVVPQP